MIDISMPEPFGCCALDRCPGRCPYRDEEMMTPEGRARLLDGPFPAVGQPWPPRVVHVRYQPEDIRMDIPRYKAKNVGILLATLGLRPGTAIVACGDRLLTPDIPLYPEQNILVRKVMSSG